MHPVLTTRAFAQSTPDTGPRIASRYDVVRPLAHGVFGDTVLAMDAVLRRLVVLKGQRGAEGRLGGVADAFLREARLAAAVEHPNVARVYDYGVDRGRPFIVFELADGRNLEQCVRQDGILAVSFVRLVLLGIVAGLRALHRVGVIHGDLSAANVVVDARGGVKITDFGSAARFGSADAAAGGHSASPAFMSPEAARGEPLSRASDAYSAAALAHYCLTGAPYLAMAGLSWPQVVAMISSARPRALPASVDRRLARLLMRALCKNPLRRPSLESMTRALVSKPQRHKVRRPGKAVRTGPPQ